MEAAELDKFGGIVLLHVNWESWISYSAGKVEYSFISSLTSTFIKLKTKRLQKAVLE